MYTETGSAFDVALLGIAGLVPRIAFGIFSGTFADRYSRLRLMIVADSFRAATMIALAASLFTFGFNLYIVLGSVFVLGLGQSLFRPAINSFLPTAVSKEDLGTANGFFTAAQEVTSVIGSPLGGILIGVFGAVAAFLFNGGSYVISGLLIVSVSLTLSHRKEAAKTSDRPSFFQELKGGLAYVNREKALLKLTLASFGANFFLSLFFTFIVIYVTDVLHQGPVIFGILSAAGATGFGVGSLMVGRLRAERKFGVWFSVPWGLAGLAILGMVFSHVVILGALFLFLTGFFGGFGNTVFFTGVQKFVPNAILGRYLSLDEVGSLAASPAGQIAGGLLIAALGIGVDFALAGIGTTAFTLGLLLFSDVRALKVE